MKNDFIGFENYLNQSIEDLIKLKGLRIKDNKFAKFSTKNVKIIQLEMDASYFNIFLNKIQVYLNDKGQIQSISLFSKTILDTFFLNEFDTYYMKPNQILRRDKLITESKTSNFGDFNQSLIKKQYAMQDVTYNAKPEIILWQKGAYEIEIRFDYEHALTLIRFRNRK